MGVKIQVDAPSLLSAVRFYKDDQETGTHTASVWASDGTLLGQADFTTETASGWQQVQLTSQLPLHRNATYVIGVNANNTFVQTQHGELLFKGDSLELQFDADLAGDFASAQVNSDDFQLGLSPGEDRTTPEAYLWNPAGTSARCSPKLTCSNPATSATC